MIIKKTHLKYLFILFSPFFITKTDNKLDLESRTAIFNQHLINNNTVETDHPILKHLNNLLIENNVVEENQKRKIKIVKSEAPKMEEKEWTCIIYIAADNDLRNFAIRNIQQMTRIGSTDHINIVIHLDIKLTSGKKATYRYFIKKDEIVHLNANEPSTQCMDSGDTKTVTSFAEYSIKNFPAKNVGLIFWNHGSGALEPMGGRIINAANLFTINPTNNKLVLDRSHGFIEIAQNKNKEQRGICWDDSTGNFITNKELEDVLKYISEKCLYGKKIAILGFDACLMQMVEITNIAKKYADIMVGSQEVELGNGWNYADIFSPFKDKSLDKKEFAQHIVKSYEDQYINITNDFTLSAINLENIKPLEQNINELSYLLMQALRLQKNNSVKQIIKISKNRLLCTHFDEPSYLDLYNLYHNFLANLCHIQLFSKKETEQLCVKLKTTLEEGLCLIQKSIIDHVKGESLANSYGLSIYFPEYRIHQSYRHNPFAKTNDWILFLTQYLII